MIINRFNLGIVAGLLLGAPACAQQWFAVSAPGAESSGALVEVDLDTVRASPGGGESVIRISYDVLRPHPSGFGYRSLVATAQYECQTRAVTYASAAFFAQPKGQGLRLAVESAGREGGMPAWLAEGLPAAARQALLKAICSASPS